MSRPPPWIPVKKRLPTRDAAYLIYAPSMDKDKPFISIAWYDPKFGWSHNIQYWLDAVTHWMPLPKPPK